MRIVQDQRADPLSQESSLKRRALATALQALIDPALTRLKVDDRSRTVLHCLRDIMVADNLAIHFSLPLSRGTFNVLSEVSEL